jgi:predicted esterase
LRALQNGVMTFKTALAMLSESAPALPEPPALLPVFAFTWLFTHLPVMRLTFLSRSPYGLLLAAALGCGTASPPDSPSGSSGGSASSSGGSGAGGAPVGSGGSVATGGLPALGGSLGGSIASGGTVAESGGAPAESGGTGGADGGLGGGSAAGGASGGTDAAGGSSNPPSGSAGCGRDSALKNSPGATLNYNDIMVGASARRYVLRLPTDYDREHPYQLILGFHGATGNANEVAGGNSPYFGLYDRAEGSTIFVAMEAVGGIWSNTSDLAYVDAVLEELQSELCIDPSRIGLEGFSQGGAMAYTLACARPGLFWATVTHSPGGLPLPATCEPIPYFSSLGQQENDRGQTMTADFFAETNGCEVQTLTKAPTGGHLCSYYQGCGDGFPVRFCPYDGGHTPSPRDSGQGMSWMPDEVWNFLSQIE